MLLSERVDSATGEYIQAVCRTVTATVGDMLLGMYATGSIAFDDYESSRSDIDLLGVIQGDLTPYQRDALRRDLSHDRLPCPANGLEIGLVPLAMASSPPREPYVDFAMATGHSWRLAVDQEEEDAEYVLHFAICRAAGLPVVGPPAGSVFGEVSREWILDELAAMLEWHLTQILDPYHDPLGQFSTLNACRALCFARTGAFCSKTAGGRWMLRQDPSQALVAAALENRSGGENRNADCQAIRDFLILARDTVRA